MRGAGQIVLQLAWVLTAVLLVLGLVDYGLRYRRFESMLRTTTQEQREDRRVIEGDPAASPATADRPDVPWRLARIVDRRHLDTERCGWIDACSGGWSTTAASDGSHGREGTRRDVPAPIHRGEQDSPARCPRSGALAGPPPVGPIATCRRADRRALRDLANRVKSAPRSRSDQCLSVAAAAKRSGARCSSRIRSSSWVTTGSC